MDKILEEIRGFEKEHADWFEKLTTIFDAMDAVYEEAATAYGFTCRGCEDSCCLTRFYHHTLLEYAFLHKGYERLAENARLRAKAKAAACCKTYASADAAGRKTRVMCPLNVEGKCTVYQFRPMICRMHGIPHELHPPGRETQYGPGCDCFTTKNDGKHYHAFDRTPFYKAMAGLEKRYRGMLHANGKFRRTIAEMVLTF